MLEFICTKIKNEEPEFANSMNEVKGYYNSRNTDINALSDKEKEIKQMIANADSAK